jgi:DHA2 family multidrug resistance protein
MLQRMQQTHQAYLGARLTASSPQVQAAVQQLGAQAGVQGADAHVAGLALLYQQVGRQASLLAYMDQYRRFGYMLACLLPLVLLLKRPPKIVGKIELEVH